MKQRKNSYAFCGGAFGDEGKGRIVDQVVSEMVKKRPVIVYRDNGGANAGHTVVVPGGNKIALHQLPSGVFHARATVILGKGMVIHPGDLLQELHDVTLSGSNQTLAKIMMDEMAVLALDTHRALEFWLNTWESGGKGATGRGIAPAYADILYRHPLRLRDLKPFNETKLKHHFQLYKGLIGGLGGKLEKTQVPALGSSTSVLVGSEQEFIKRLRLQAQGLDTYIQNVFNFLSDQWQDEKVGFVFEKAQAIGLDTRWGVYPDVTASDTTIFGIAAGTEGIVDPLTIAHRLAVIKATYMSSVGTRKLPTLMPASLAGRIREDAHEYGATTKRPRDIAYLDLPALKFFMKQGGVNELVLTHMDIAYPKVAIKVCKGYTYKGKPARYRPDQVYLSQVKPVYLQFEPWNQEVIAKARTWSELPAKAKRFLKFISQELNLPVTMITTGPLRDQGISIH